MVKMHDIRRSASDVKAEKKALGKDSEHAYVPPEDDGARFELEPHHLEKMGIGDELKHGDTVHFHGHGTVERSTSEEQPRATVRFHHGAMEHEAGDREQGAKNGIRGDLESAHDKSSAKASAKSAAADKKIPEKAGGKD